MSANTQERPPAAPEDVAGLLRTLWDRQVDGWFRGERISAEAMLAQHAGLGADDGFAELVVNEIDLREALGEAPQWEEYRQRFPQFEARLRRRFGLTTGAPAEADASRPAVAPTLPPGFRVPARAAAPKNLAAAIEAPPQPPHPPTLPAKDFQPVPPDPTPTRQAAENEPKIVPGYEILSELGRGGMGVVYKARQVALNRVVALKMILGGAHAGPEELARFRTEAEAVAQLKHANIVQVYDVGECEGRPFFSLEFVEGGSLDSKLNRKAQKARDAAGLVETLARAMHSAHEKGIVHRDLKPANILLTPDGMPKITDFGLAKNLADDSGKTHSGSVMGTPSYMAPEQAAGRVEDICPATDVYALGAILYDALTGRPPFKGATVVDTLNQVRNDEPIPPSRLQPRVPRDLETICLKCLQKSPRKRYASAQALAEDLRRFLNGEAILARPMGRAERTWRWCKRNPMAASLLVTVTLGSAFGMWHLSRLSQSLVHATALEGAAQQSETFAQMNTFYATEIVDRPKPALPAMGASTAGLLGSPPDQGLFLAASTLFPGRTAVPQIRTSVAYKTMEGNIPPPATMTIDFGDYLTAHSERGTRVRLYSDYPFRNRTDGGVHDDFEQKALDHLRERPDDPYYRFEDEGGTMVLRYATASVMKESCVNCHNNHPDSPKRDWKVGDVRGVLEITRPLDKDEARTQQGLQGTFGVAAAVAGGLLGLSLLVLIVGNRRRRSSQSAGAQNHTLS